MNFKSKKFLIPVISIFILSIGFGVFIGRFYYIINNLEIDIQYVTIIGSQIDGTILNPDIDIEMELYGTVKSPNSINVSVDFIEYIMKIDGVDFGPGVVGCFTISRNLSPFIIHHNAENLGWDAGFVIANLLLGENLTVQITIMSIKMNDMTFKPKSNFSFQINVKNL